MTKNRKVIGEGSYGCVHKPSLHCLKTQQNVNYADNVSKIMKTKEAQSELKEFVTIAKYDPTNEYHLGTPILCQPELTDKIIDNEISKCKYIKTSELKSDPNNYKILLMKFGGPDLKNLCNNELQKYLSTKSKMKTDHFWLSVHHLLKGIRFFKDNNLVHNDIKPQNILFDMKTSKLSFIDFGLMRSKDEVIKASKKSDNFLGIFHWSFPFDCGLMNKDKYYAFNDLSTAKKTAYKKQFSKIIVHQKASKKTHGIFVKTPSAFNVLFSYLNPDVTDTIKQNYIDDFFDGLTNNENNENNNYESVLERIVSSIDVYGLGFTLQYILNCFYKHHAIDRVFLTRLSAFFHKMYDFNLKTREINIDSLINEYEIILLETGILARLKKSFVNNLLVNRKPMVAEKYLEECFSNKELNSATNKCIKKRKTHNKRLNRISKKTRKV